MRDIICFLSIMRNALVILLSFVTTLSSAQPAHDWENEHVVQINRRPARSWFMPYVSQPGDSHLSLNGTWSFRWAPRPEAISSASWTTINVPANWEVNGFGTPIYSSAGYTFKVCPPYVMGEPKEGYTTVVERNPMGEYRRTFTIPDSWRDGGHTFIRFDGVMSAFYVDINGRRVGYSQGSNSPSEFDITPFLTEGENTITLTVYKYSDGSYLEDQDGWRFGGIHRDVTLFHTPQLHIRDFTVRTIATDDTYRDFLLQINPQLESLGGGKGDGFSVFATLYDTEGNHVATSDTLPATPIIDADNKAAVMNEWFPQRGRMKFGRISIPVMHARQWTAETPYLYSLRITLLDASGHIVQQASQRVGMRQLEIKGGRFLVNGKQVRFRGVNRVEHDPHTAHAISYERMLQDIILMKEANINAVRTAHYPSHPRFYDLCDSLGMYVLDEADCENHGVRGKLTSTPSWNTAMMDRVIRLAERDKNHPSVVFWSLGNESGFGANHSAMAGWLHEFDPTRFVHYEGAQGTTEGEAEAMLKADGLAADSKSIATWREGFIPDPPCVDVISRFYPRVMDEYLNPGIPEGSDKERAENARWEHLLAIAQREWKFSRGYLNGVTDTRPVLTSEYAHCMGNALGNFKEYWDEIYSNPRMLGGFIWDWVDQGIICDGKVLYGGDFNDKPNLKAFCLNGVVRCDRSLTAKYHEVRHVYSPVQFSMHDDGALFVINRNHHIGLEAFVASARFIVDGKPQKPFTVSFPDVSPGDSTELGDLTAKVREMAGSGSDVRLDISVVRRRQQTTVICEQITLKADTKRIIADVRKKAVRGLKPGRMALPEIRATFFRAPTDNDKSFGNWLAKDWTRNNIASPEISVLKEMTAENPSCPDRPMTVREEKYSFKEGHIIVTTTVKPLTDGSYDVEQQYVCHGVLPELPRMGMQIILPRDFSKLEYYGRGPWDTFPDRWRSTRVGWWKSSVTDEYAHYPVPQDCGNHRETSALTLSSAKGEAITVTASGEPFSFSALPFTAQEISSVRHDHDLPQSGHTVLCIDTAVLGIGNSSCGPGVLKRHSIDKSKTHTLRLNIVVR